MDALTAMKQAFDLFEQKPNKEWFEVTMRGYYEQGFKDGAQFGYASCDSDWTDDVAEVKARLDADDAERAKNAKHMGVGTRATGKADSKDEGRGSKSLSDAEEPGVAREEAQQGEQ